MKKSLLLAALLATAHAAAHAAEPVPRGWYVAPLLAYMQPDSARCGVDAGPGAAAVVGHRGESGALELWGQFLTLPKGECTYTVPDGADTDSNRDVVTEPAGDVDLHGGGVSLRVGTRLFGLVGFGVLRREGHPQYAQGDTTIVGDVGFGYLQPFRLFGTESGLRAEARYRYDVQQPPHPDEQEPAPAHQFSDVIVNLGLQFALSEPPAPLPPPAEPVSVVPAAEPPPEAAPAPVPEAAVAETAAEPTLETAKAGDTIVLHGVNFETARATLTTNAKTILDDVAAKLGARPGLRVEVGGHTDARGADAYNQDLSERRANAVRDYLAARGVDAARLSAVGYGEGAPVDSNDTDEGRERNRRVELKILEQGSDDANP